MKDNNYLNKVLFFSFHFEIISSLLFFKVVKIVQRIPVKIVFDEEIDPEEYNIVAGMSVIPKVRIK